MSLLRSHEKEQALAKEEIVEKEKEDVIRRVRSLLKLAACKDAGKKMSRKAREARQTEQWKAIFSQCDKSGSGTLSFEDIKRMARKYLKIAERLVTDDNLRTFFSAIDEDGGGSVDFSEFLTFVNMGDGSDEVMQERILRQVKRTVRLAMWKQRMTLEDAERRFYNCAEEGIIDIANTDGSLGPEEMRRFFRKVLHVSKHDAPDKNLMLAFNAMDQDQGGTLDAEEFIDFLRQALQDDSSKSSSEAAYTPLMGGMRGSLPGRAPRSRPGMQPNGQLASVPFCLNGRDVLSNHRTSCNVAAPLRQAMVRQSRSTTSLPSLTSSPTSASQTAFATKSPANAARSTAVLRSVSADDLEDDVGPIKDNYLNMKGADSLNRVEHWLYNAGIDFRGHYHRLAQS